MDDYPENDGLEPHEESHISEAEKVTRFGCGALFGFVIGLYFVVKLMLDSFGTAAAVIVAAMCVCGYLALRHGDAFWYAIFGGRN